MEISLRDVIGIKKVAVLILYIGWSSSASILAQHSNSRILTIEEVVSLAISQNPQIKISQGKVDAAEAQKQGALDLGSTNFNYQYGWGNSTMYDQHWELTQNLGSPLTQYKKVEYATELKNVAKSGQILTEKQLTNDAKSAYTLWVYRFIKLKLLENESARYNELFQFNEDTSMSNGVFPLKSLILETQFADIQNQFFQAQQEYLLATNQVKTVLYMNEDVTPADTLLEIYAIKTINNGVDKFYPVNHFYFFNSIEKLQSASYDVQRTKYFPEITVGYYNQKIGNIVHFQGYKIGLSIPLWFFPQKAKVEEARINLEITKNENEYKKFLLEKKIESLKIQLDQLFVSISYYRENELVLANRIEENAFSMKNRNEMDNQTLMDELNKVLKSKLAYLDKVRDYNLTAIQLEFYIN